MYEVSTGLSWYIPGSFDSDELLKKYARINFARVINSILKTSSGDNIEMIVIQSPYFMSTYQMCTSFIWAPL